MGVRFRTNSLCTDWTSVRVCAVQVSHFLRAPIRRRLVEMLDRDMEFARRRGASGEAPAWSALDELNRDAAEDAVRRVSRLSPVELWTRVGSAPARWRGAVLEGGVSRGALVADVREAAPYAALLAPPRPVVVERLTLDLRRARACDLMSFANVLREMPSLHTLALHGPLPASTRGARAAIFGSDGRFLEEFADRVAEALEVKMGTVRSRLNRARSALREIVGDLAKADEQSA